MILNHIGLTSNDVFETRAFLEKYFGLKGLGKNNHSMVHLQDDQGLILSIVKGEPESCHIGFMQESTDEVDEIYNRLTSDGYKADPPQHSHGYTFYITIPGGVIVEVVS